MIDIKLVQQEIRKRGMDGWLFYDFHNRDAMAYRILGLEFNKFTSRRWYYLIPAQGEPRKLVSGVESSKLDPLQGQKIIYRSWREQHRLLKELLKGCTKIAMQYSPTNNIPYISMVDAGTIELIRSLGVEVVSSADLVQIFEAIIDEKGYQAHLQAGLKVQKIKDEAFDFIGHKIRRGERVTEYEVQQFIIKRFKEEGLTDDGDHPIVAINDHAADPHFEPKGQNTYTIKKDDKLLIDLWARLDREDGIYYDITWCGFIGNDPPARYREIFETVRNARNAGRDFVRQKFIRGEKCFGYEVDDVCRGVITKAGYGEYFVHRTGHSIGHEVHGNGVNIDNFETKDERELVPGICFSLEPAIYLPGEMGARSEVNVFIAKEREVIVAGKEQEELILIY
ncbi:MAG: M24 family metallopeptidase [Acidobacteriota bacterium]